MSVTTREALAAIWKDGEVGYCARLVDSRGNRSVPTDAVASYLDLQRSDAARRQYEVNRAAVAELDALILAWARISQLESQL